MLDRHACDFGTFLDCKCCTKHTHAIQMIKRTTFIPTAHKSISSRVPQKASDTMIWDAFGDLAGQKETKKYVQKRDPFQSRPSNNVRMHAF
jgi:hypothetical protein